LNTQQIVIGRFGAVYGIKGWLKINSFTDHAENIFEYTPWVIQQKGQMQTILITDWKRHNNGLICKLKDIDTREDAQALTGLDIIVAADHLPSLPKGEYYWRDLIGCAVVTTKGYQLGSVTELMETGSNDVLVVKANPNDAFGTKERLIPFIDDQVILNIDVSARMIEVNWDPDF